MAIDTAPSASAGRSHLRRRSRRAREDLRNPSRRHKRGHRHPIFLDRAGATGFALRTRAGTARRRHRAGIERRRALPGIDQPMVLRMSKSEAGNIAVGGRVPTASWPHAFAGVVLERYATLLLLVIL